MVWIEVAWRGWMGVKPRWMLPREPGANFDVGQKFTRRISGVATTRTRRIRVNSCWQVPFKAVGTENGGQGQVHLILGSG